MTAPGNHVGKVGRQVGLVANLYQFSFAPITVYQYDVEIVKVPYKVAKMSGNGEPLNSPPSEESALPEDNEEMKSKSEKFLSEFSDRIFKCFANDEENAKIFGSANSYVYDGAKTLYTSKKLAINRPISRLVATPINNRVNYFQVSLKLVRDGEISVEEAVRYYTGDQSVGAISPKVCLPLCSPYFFLKKLFDQHNSTHRSSRCMSSFSETPL